MKLQNFVSFAIILSFPILLCSCEIKKSELQSQSPDGSVQIIITGNKTFMEPWDLSIHIKAQDKSDTLKAQLYADEINEKNIIFNWTDNTTCIIKLTHQDGESRLIEVSI